MPFDPAEYDRLARSACFVCPIVEGNLLVPNLRVVYEDDHVIAFLNHFPTQEGYTIVCPKRHVERFERDLNGEEWIHLQTVVQAVALAVGEATGAIRMYIASLGSPERNAHVHIHVCPCPKGTPFAQQQFAAMEQHIDVSDERMDQLATQIRDHVRHAPPFG